MTDLSVTIEKTIKEKIYTIRGQKVMLDYDAADLYEVDLKTLRRTVVRNNKRFPSDFQFQLTNSEWMALKSRPELSVLQTQNAPPIAFTEGGLLMLSGVLKSKKAVDVGIAIIDTLFSILRS